MKMNPDKRKTENCLIKKKHEKRQVSGKMAEKPD